MKHIISSLLILLFANSIQAQSQIVNTFNYNSTTRDTVVEFPTGDHNQYEKIIMHYSMRCKDGLVSTGTNRNLGCGEWDYSCNTYIIDSSRVDSVKAIASDYIIPGFSGDSLIYSTEPTYSYSESTQTKVEYNTIITQNILPVLTGSEANNLQFGKAGSRVQLNYFLEADSLLSAGVEQDQITGISFNISGGELLMKNLRVKAAQTSSASLDENLSSFDWQELYYYSTTMNMEENLIRLKENLDWDGVSNLVIQISYDAATGTDLAIQNTAGESNNHLYNDLATNNYLDINATGHIHVPGGFDDIQNEITVAFWQNGSDVQPVNSTIFEGRDANNKRQINVHLPWSDGNVYWDCGDEGNGYDRISKQANPADYKNQWNHWAFTKNATTGEMHIYLNGALWQSGTQKYNAINIDEMNIGSAIINGNLFYFGKLDEFSIWNKALNEGDIHNIMNRKISSDDPNYSHLQLYYSFDNFDTDGAKDHSDYGNDGTTVGRVNLHNWTANDVVTGAETIGSVPELNLHQGLYFVITEDIVVRDSLQNFPYQVDHYIVEGTDLVLEGTQYLYASGEMPVVNENGEVVDVVQLIPDGTIHFSELSYYSKSPMAYEIMSFVTPYGIGLDFGMEGHTWTFDVTDFGPILKGNKRIYLSRGGQWQEDMDIRFEFIEGIPDRNVIDIQQIWPVQAVGYTSILDDWRYEPRSFDYDPNVSTYLVKSVITGHGQQGEFIPRNHSMGIGGFSESWQVWMECADNPIYPQGGTWPFDRAGWCPGAPSQMEVIDISEYLQFLGTADLDYHIQTASGDSRYIVDNKLVKYGAPNKGLDLGIEDVIYPNKKIEYGRFNPSCRNPQILIKNHGAVRVTSATIEYGVIGSSMHSYEWVGDLSFLEEETVDLDFINALSEEAQDRIFYVGLVSINGASDDYAQNNELTTEVVSPPHFEGDLILDFRTNNFAHETSYRVFDSEGNVLLSRIGSVLSANRNYRDTLRNLNGCYRILVEDSNDTGISFWYAIQQFGEGSGYLRIKESGGSFQDIATDFGKFVDYHFSIGTITDTKDIIQDESISIYPNPSQGVLFFEGLDSWDKDINIKIADLRGRELMDQTFEKLNLINGINNLKPLDSGMYIINITDGKRNYSEKIFIESGK